MSFYRDENRRRGARSVADERWRLARARDAELKNQQRLGLVAPTSYLEQILDLALGYLRTELSALAAMYTRDVKERRRLDDLLRNCLEHLADEFVAGNRVKAAGCSRGQ